MANHRMHRKLKSRRNRCSFSRSLAPIFEEAAAKVQKKSQVPGKVVFAEVDCVREIIICKSLFGVKKYPTLKLFRGGKVKREYLGQQSAKTLANFMLKQAKDSVHEAASLDKLDEIDAKKRRIIGYFESKTSDNYRIFARVASILRDYCEFHSAIGTVSLSERTNGDHVFFRPPHTVHHDVQYTGQLTDSDALQ